jgi:hypothetical protein
VKVDAVSADFTEQIGNFHRRDRLAGRAAEGIAADVADGPEAKSELHFRVRRIVGGHISLDWI